MALLIRIRSAINFNDQYVRHFNNEAELSVLDSPFNFDFIFEVVDVGNFQVRFKSTNNDIKPPKFLRHKNFRLLLEGEDPTHSELFRLDTTFTRLEPRAQPSGSGDFFSYQSVNFPERFIRHIDFHVFIDEMKDDQAKRDATFAEEQVGGS